MTFDRARLRARLLKFQRLDSERCTYCKQELPGPNGYCSRTCEELDKEPPPNFWRVLKASLSRLSSFDVD